MTRFFYTDPLAAAWMAKHHSMRFQNLNNGQEFGLREILIHAGTGNVCHINIHPDSLHLLQPQVGDWFAYHHTGMERAQIFGPLEAEFIKGALSEFVPGRFIGEVIKRNGMPFIWPESEAA